MAAQDTPNGTSMMWNAKVNAIWDRAHGTGSTARIGTTSAPNAVMATRSCAPPARLTTQREPSCSSMDPLYSPGRRFTRVSGGRQGLTRVISSAGDQRDPAAVTVSGHERDNSRPGADGHSPAGPDGVLHPHTAGAACQQGHVRGAPRTRLRRDPGVDRV